MSDEAVAAALRELSGEQRRAAAAGDLPLLAELEERSAMLHTASGNEADARRALRRAVQHRVKAGDPARLAKTRYGLALLEARLPGRSAASRTGFEQALEGFRSAQQHDMIGRTLLRLAGLDISEKWYQQAATASREAAAAFAEVDQLQQGVDALRLGSIAAQLGGDTPAALRLLTEAMATAPSTDMALSIRLDGEALGLLESPTPAELDDMLADVVDSPMRGPLLLMRATERAATGALEAAETDAQEARALALAGPDPVLYLMACLQLAGVREAAGDRTGLLTVLFSCQASLGDLLGNEAQVPVLQVIDGLRSQWGEDVFEAEMARYRAQFEENAS